MNFGLKSSSLFIAIFAVTIISLIGFSNHNAYADTFTAVAIGPWNNADTWGVDALPGPSDAVIIPSGITVTIPDGLVVTLDHTGTLTVDSGGTLTVESGGTITSDGTITNSGAIFNFGGTITNISVYAIGDGTITNDGGTITNDGIMENQGPFNNLSGSTIINGGTITNISTITNSGTIFNYLEDDGGVHGGTIDNDGDLTNLSGSTINNDGSPSDPGTLTNNENAFISNYGIIHNNGNGIIYNAPIADGGEGTITNYCDSTFTNSGTVSGNPIVDGCPATIDLDKTTYLLTDTAQITVMSSAANANPLLVDTINVGVKSTSDPTGKTIGLVETGSNTGIFIGSIQFTSDETGLRLHAETGDTITATFSGHSDTATIETSASSISATIDNESPRWGIDPVGVSGTATGATETDSIIVHWGDGSTTIVPAGVEWGPVSHTYGSSAVGANTVNATLEDDSGVIATSENTIVNVQKHNTQLVLNPLNDVVAGTGVNVIGNLVDTDTSTGLDGKPITFDGTGATGLLTVNTQGIEFNGTGMTVDSCGTCTPFLGSTNVLHLNAGNYIKLPPGTVGISLTLQEMGTNGFQIKVTNTNGVKSLYSGSAAGPDITVFSPPSDLAGISRIDIVSITGGNPGNFGLSEIKTANPGGDPTTTYDAGFGGVAVGSYANLKVLTGDYSSIGLTSSTPTPGLSVQAHFAGDTAYSASNSNTVSYNTITPTFGVGGSETSGIITFTATPFSSVFCSKADPDNDRDSLCDSWENQTDAHRGIPYTVGLATFHYPLTGASKIHKDVFVEADAMNGVWSATYQSAINDVITAFTKAPLKTAAQSQQRNPDNTNGINLHVTIDEIGLTKASALNVWTDTDTNQTNDYFTIKGAHFGTATEHPTLGGTQTNGPASAAAAPSQVIKVSGLTLTTPTLATKGDNANSATQGTITIKQQVNLGVASTIATPIAAPVQTGAATASITWGAASATILSGAGTAQQIIAVTIPFTTTGPVSAASMGIISTTLSLSPSAAVTSVVTAVNSPSVSDTLLQAKAQAYRYALFTDCITKCGLSTNPSGLAEQTGTPKAGNDIVIGLGPESGFTASQNNIAGTFMHELGHTLGLQHGGPQYTYSGSIKTLAPDSSQNCKPNYESIMSYSRQFTTYLGSAWNLNYSSGTFGPLTETALVEPNGLLGNAAVLSTPPTIVYGYNSGAGVYQGTTSTTVNSGQTNPGIDWNKIGGVSGTVSAPIQDLGITGCNTATALSSPISDYNDWLNLNYNFTSTGSFNGLYSNPIYLQEATVKTLSEQTAQVTPHFILAWGTFGTSNTQLKIPSGVAVDTSGNVYVADSGNNRIVKFSNDGVYITKWGSTGSGNIQFKTPTGIALDSSGVYVVDSGNNRVQKFSSAGVFITKWGSSGSGDGKFNAPIGVAVDSSGSVYVSDSGNGRIEKFSGTGTFITKWGSSGSGDGKFIVPTGLAADSSGNVYVADSGNNRVQKFNNAGTFITKWGSFGTGDGQLKIPSGLAVDSSGNVYVSDSGNNRNEKFTNTGNFITKWGSLGTGNGKFVAPTGITVDSLGNIFSSDSGNNRIEKWGP